MLHIAAQNLKGALSYPERTEALFESIDKQPEADRPDVVFYSEAYDVNVNPIYGASERPAIAGQFRELGYDSLHFDYADTDGRKHDRNGGWLAVKEQVCGGGGIRGEYVNLLRRTGALAMVQDPETREEVWVLGTHLDHKSGANRHAMVDAVAWKLAASRQKVGGRLVLAGVLDSTEQDDPNAEALRRLGRYREPRVVRALWDAVAATPGKQPQRGLRRKLSLAGRVIDMANDGVADRLRDMGLVSVDPLHTPTVEGGGHALRLDDIRYNPDALTVASQGIESRATGIEADVDNHLHAGNKVWAKLQVARTRI